MPRYPHTLDEALSALENCSDSAHRDKLAHFGVIAENAYGVRMPDIRAVAKEIAIDQSLAEQLWDCGVHEAKMLATMIADKRDLSDEQLERWIRDVYSWDICDQLCGGLIEPSNYCEQKINEWVYRDETFVKRAGFALIATCAVHNKRADDKTFLPYFELIEQNSTDERNFVKKAVNWALRQMGKRSLFLHTPALNLSLELIDSEDPTARWIGKDAYKELSSPKLIERLRVKATTIKG